MRVAGAGLVAAVLLLALGGCGDDTTDLDPEVRVISVSGLTFSQADVTVASGTTVRWVNGSTFLHTVTPDGHTQWTDAQLPAGQQFEHTFNTPGTYAYFCTPHQLQGMTGVIRVQ